jgi:starch synthase
VVQGSGPAELVSGLRALASARPGEVVLIERFDRDMARRIYAGVDGFLMPSRFEPCGTGQMISLRYGTPPIVHATGGLRDTVRDEHDSPGAGTGFVFRHPTADGLRWACGELARRFRAGGGAWESLLERGMAVDFDWRTGSAPAYVAAYRRAIGLRRAIPPATARDGPRIDHPTKVASSSPSSAVERLAGGPIKG